MQPAQPDLLDACANRRSKFSPWPPPASTTTGFGPCRFSMAVVAGSCPVLFNRHCKGRNAINHDAASRFRRTCPKKISRCNLLHKKPGRPGLNPGNDPESPAIVDQGAHGPAYRLRTDSRRYRGLPFCADLSPPDLNSPSSTRRRSCPLDVRYRRAEKGSVRQKLFPP
jgi:hypothetical protein